MVEQARALGHELSLPIAPPAAAAARPTRADVRRVLIVVDRFFPSVGGTERLAEAVGTSLHAHGMTVAVATRPLPERPSCEHRGMTIHEIDGDLVASLYAVAMGERYDAVLAFANATVWPIIATLQLPHPRPRVVVVPCVNADDSAGLRAPPDVMRSYAELLSGADAVGFSSSSGYDIRLCEDLGVSGVYVPNGRRAHCRAGGPGAYGGNSRRRAPALHGREPVAGEKSPRRARRPAVPSRRLAARDDRRRRVPRSRRRGAETGRPRSARAPAGPHSPDAVAAAIEHADVLLLPSLAEATPLVLLEAMSREVPWIATPTCGAAHDYSGGLVLPLERFGEGIDFLLANPAQASRLGAAGRRHWQDCYTWDVIGPRYARIVRGEPVADLAAPAQAVLDTDCVRASFYDGRVRTAPWL